MSNIRIGGKTYRDVEKMSLDELRQVAQAMFKRSTVLQKTTEATVFNKGSMHRGSAVIAEIQALEKRSKLIDHLMKQREADEQTAQAPSGA
jgi:hypothetical protein